MVYVVFNYYCFGDFKFYIFKIIDGGISWMFIYVILFECGSVYIIVEDYVKVDFLFCGMEFGVFMMLNGGDNWI